MRTICSMLVSAIVCMFAPIAAHNLFTCVAYYKLLEKSVDAYLAEKASADADTSTQHTMRVARQGLHTCAQIDPAQLNMADLQRRLHACSDVHARLQVKGLTRNAEDPQSIQRYASFADRYLWYYWDVMKSMPSVVWRYCLG